MPQKFELLEPESRANSLKIFAAKPAVMIGGGLVALLLIFSISLSMSGRGTTLGAGGPQPPFNTVSLIAAGTAQACAGAESLVLGTDSPPSTGEAGASWPERTAGLADMPRSAYDDLAASCAVKAQGCRLCCFHLHNHTSSHPSPLTVCYMCSCLPAPHCCAWTPLVVQDKCSRPFPPRTQPHTACRSPLHASGCLRSARPSNSLCSAGDQLCPPVRECAA